MVFGHLLSKSMINDGVSKVNLSEDWHMYCTLKETNNAVYRVASKYSLNRLKLLVNKGKNKLSSQYV